MKVSIRPIKKSDAEISYVWRNDPEIWQLTGSKPNKKISLRNENEWIEKVLLERDSARFAIEVDGKYIGNIYLTNILNDTAQYHIFIGDKQYWGKGVAYAASRQIIDYGINVLNLIIIYLYVKKLHERAIRLYNSLGFKIVSEDDGEYRMEYEIK